MRDMDVLIANARKLARYCEPAIPSPVWSSSLKSPGSRMPPSCGARWAAGAMRRGKT